METLILHINGMVCENSVKQVCHSLESMRGVKKVEVDTLARKTLVEHDERTCAVGEVLEAVALAGYQVDHVDLDRPGARDADIGPSWRPTRRDRTASPV